MSIPNVSTLYQRIHKGSEGGNEFARFIKLLLLAEYNSQNASFISESDASGDFKGVDGYVQENTELPEMITAFQYKFFPDQLTAQQKTEIEKSIVKALEANPLMQELIIITPEDFQVNNQEWFEGLQCKYSKVQPVLRKRYFPFFHTFNLHHWGHTKIVELSLRHDHIGTHYFPELFTAGIGQFKLAKASIDTEGCLWCSSQSRLNTFYQTERKATNDNITSDPIFDFQFTNNTNEIHLLNIIEIHIEEVWTDIKGIPQKQLLKSIGTIEHKIDFTKPINQVFLLDPMIFEAQKPLRFKVQLKDFVKECKGNFVHLKFLFLFGKITIPTTSFVLDF